MEHFLCFVEMVQFKENVIAIVQQQNGQFDQETVVGHRHRLYGHCPKSSIVFNGPDGLSLKELGVVESVHEVNFDRFLDLNFLSGEFDLSFCTVIVHI
mgnify:CR=1 FL=1